MNIEFIFKIKLKVNLQYSGHQVYILLSELPLYHYAEVKHDKKILQISFKPNHKFLLRTIMHFYISTLINLEDYLESPWK